MLINFAIEYYMLILLIGFLLIYVYKNEPEIIIKDKKTCSDSKCYDKLN